MTADLTPSCLAARIWASAEIDGEATPAEREALDRHVVECTACRDWIATAGALARAVRAAEPVAPPATIAVAPADEPAAPGSSAVARRLRRPRGTGGVARVAAVAAVAAAGFALAGASTAPERSQTTTLHTVTIAQAAAAPCRLSLDLHGHLVVPRTCL